jgi:hypothetical protein
MSKNIEGISPTPDTSGTQDNKGEIFVLEDINKAGDEDHDTDIIAQKRKALEDGEDVQLKSEFDTLGTMRAISVFRKTAFICAIAGFAASTDGELSHVFCVFDADIKDTNISFRPMWLPTEVSSSNLGVCVMVS